MKSSCEKTFSAGQELFRNHMSSTNLKLFSFLFLLFAILTNSTFAQSAETTSTENQKSATQAQNEKKEDVELNKEYIKGYLSDTKYILTSPARWEKDDWLKASAVVGIAAGLYVFDHNVQDSSQKHKNSTTDRIASIAKPFGEGQYTVPALGIVYLYGYAAEDRKAEKTALWGVESFLISGAFTQVLKFSTHRHRPEDGDRYDRWDGPSFSNSNLSFASGEATAAFSVATVIASEYEDKAWVPPLAYGIATLTALARINDNAHWASDVFVGSAIGYFTAKTIVALHKKNSRFQVVPLTDGQHNGLAISYKF
jgi:membrane-associated phospholipid phosphatase